MKFILSTLITLLAFNASADLKAGSQARVNYSNVNIMKINSIKENIVYSPQSKTSVAIYQGTVEVNVTVEGNTCGDDAQTLGTLFSRMDNKLYVGLVTGAGSTKMKMCPQYSAPTEVSFLLNVYAPEFKGEDVNTGLGIVSFSDNFSGTRGEADIRLQAKDGKFKVVIK
ncbi:MAG: hypothetical protein EOP04_17430 [Proteobacteria bacterium]|nr:MAG: hypothetical protein EOP04_17430 [Pseudomonadota bacterium]